MNSFPNQARKSFAQLFILSLATVLMSLYMGRNLPAGLDLFTLQVGLLGTITFLSLTSMTQVAACRKVASAGPAAASNVVERRLDRYVPPSHIGRTRKTPLKHSVENR